jgi:hypothetical protein
MKKISQNKKTGNVLNIADNPKFTNRKLIVAGRGANHGEFVSFTLSANTFGLAEGDSLICKTEFDTNEIQDNTLVIVETPSGYSLTSNVSDTTSVYAIVKGFQRDL